MRNGDTLRWLTDPLYMAMHADSRQRPPSEASKEAPHERCHDEVEALPVSAIDVLMPDKLMKRIGVFHVVNAAKEAEAQRYKSLG
jgi:hypothetical protein